MLRISSTHLLSALLALTLTGAVSPAYAEIYRWVDDQGRVHFGDKRSAPKTAKPNGEQEQSVTSDGLTFTFLPQADALLSTTHKNSQGKSSVLSSGYWSTPKGKLETKSLIQFEITPVLKELNTNKHKHLANALIELYANTDDKLYGQGTTNKQSPGHSTLRGDNAFYLRPTHNNWQEGSVTWSEFYGGRYIVPSGVRQLPVISARGSNGDPDKNYIIDATELIAALILTQQREVTLEMTPQRTSTMAQVTFYAREAQENKRPRLIVKLK